MEIPKHATYPVWVPEWQAEREFQLMTFWGAARPREGGGRVKGGEEEKEEEKEKKEAEEMESNREWCRHFFSDTWRVRLAQERKTRSADLFSPFPTKPTEKYFIHTTQGCLFPSFFPFFKKWSVLVLLKSCCSLRKHVAIQKACHFFYPHICKYSPLCWFLEIWEKREICLNVISWQALTDSLIFTQ